MKTVDKDFLARIPRWHGLPWITLLVKNPMTLCLVWSEASDQTKPDQQAHWTVQSLPKSCTACTKPLP